MTDSKQTPSPTESPVIDDQAAALELEKSVADLDYYIEQLSSLGSLIILCTAFNLISSLVSVFVWAIYPSQVPVESPYSQHFYVSPFRQMSYMASGLSLGCALTAIWFLTRYESCYKRGLSLFIEVSDELQWFIRQAGNSNTQSSSSGAYRPNIKHRIVLRKFNESSLAFTSGKNAALLYMIANLTLLIASFIFTGQMARG